MRTALFRPNTALLATAFFVVFSGCYTQVATHDHDQRVVERRTVYVTDEVSGEIAASEVVEESGYREGYQDGFEDASQYRRYFRRFYPATALYFDTECGWDWTYCSSYTHLSFGWGSYWPTYYYSPSYWHTPWYAHRPYRPYAYYAYGPFYGGYRYDAPGMVRGRDFEPRGNTIGRGGLNVASTPGRSVGRTSPSTEIPRGDSRTVVTAPVGGEAGKTVPMGRVTGRPSSAPVGRGELGRTTTAPDSRRESGRTEGSAPARNDYRTPPPSRRTETNAPASRPAPRTESRPAPRTESRPAPRTESAPASRPAPRTESRPAPRTESRPAPRTESAPASRPAPRNESRPAPSRGSDSGERSAPRGRTSDNG